MSLFNLVKESAFLARIFTFIAHRPPPDFVPGIWCDNKSAIKMAQSASSTRRTKHIDVKYNYTKQCVEEKRIRLRYIPTGLNFADPLTKVSRRSQLDFLFTHA